MPFWCLGRGSISGPFLWRMTNDSCGRDGSMVAPPPFPHRPFPTVHVVCTANHSLWYQKYPFYPAGYGWCISLRRFQKRGFILSTILEPSGSTPIVNRFSACVVAEEFLQVAHSTDRPNDLHKATSCPGDLALFGFSLDVLAAAATAWNFLSLRLFCSLIFQPGFSLHPVIRPDLVRPSFRLS